jgi:hypothetical protein
MKENLHLLANWKMKMKENFMLYLGCEGHSEKNYLMSLCRTNNFRSELDIL